jgi:hypothetical protein
MQESVCPFSLWTGPKNVAVMGVEQDEEGTVLEGWGFVSSPEFAV